MRYRVLESVDVDDFENLVNRYLDSGWELHGTLNTGFRETKEDRHLHFSQAVINKNLSKNDPDIPNNESSDL